MSAAEHHLITIEQNADFLLDFHMDVDLTGSTIKSELRRNPNGTLLAIFENTYTDQAAGKWTMSLTDTVTNSLNFEYAFWDLFITFSNGRVDRVMYGKVKFDRKVTA